MVYLDDLILENEGLEDFYGEALSDNKEVSKIKSDLISLLGIVPYLGVRFYDGVVGFDSNVGVLNGMLSAAAAVYPGFTELSARSVLLNGTLAVVFGEISYNTGLILRNNF